MKILSMEDLEAMFGGNGKIGVNSIVKQSDIEDIMMHEVADVAEKILLKHIQDDIYGAYTPHEFRWGWDFVPPGFVREGTDYTTSQYIHYQRRWSLLDSGSMIREMNGDTLFVTQDVQPNQSIVNGAWVPNGHGAFLQLLEVGPGPLWHGAFGRPAVSNAQKEIDSSPEIQEAFIKGLKRHGYAV